MTELKANDAAIEKNASVVPDGYEKAEGACPECSKAGKKHVLVLASGSAACMRCGKHWRGHEIVKEVKAKEAK